MSYTRAHLKIRAKGLLIGNSGKAVLLLIIPALFSLLLKAGGLFTASSARLGAWIPIFATPGWRYAAAVLLFLLAALSLLVLPRSHSGGRPGSGSAAPGNTSPLRMPLPGTAVWGALSRCICCAG